MMSVFIKGGKCCVKTETNREWALWQEKGLGVMQAQDRECWSLAATTRSEEEAKKDFTKKDNGPAGTRFSGS